MKEEFMKKTMKIISIILMAALFAAGCGGGGTDIFSTGAATPPLAAGGAGLTLDQVQGTTTPAVSATAVDINDANQVVGYVEATAGAGFKAALWTVTTGDAPTVTSRELLPLTGNTFSAAFAIDQAGRAVGQSGKGAQLVAVFWPAGASAPTELPALNTAGNSAAFGISADGTCIVGEAQNAALSTQAVIWIASAGGAFTNAPVVLPVSLVGSAFSSANGASRTPTAILVAGNAEDNAGKTHAMLWRSTNGTVFTAIDLSAAGEAGSTALAVNDAGTVAGEAETAPGIFAAAVWKADNAGVYSRSILSADGAAVEINNAGKAVGTAVGLATAWDTAALLSTTTTLFTTASQAYSNNNGDATGYMVVGVNGGKGFVKKIAN
jgi:predicted small secreted protein